MRKKQGSILIFVVWILILLTVLAASVGIRSRLGAKLSSFFRSRMSDDFLMHSAVNLATYCINRDEDPLVDSRHDDWYGPPAGFDQFKLSQRVRVTISDEESKMNLNKVTEGMLESFFKVLKENDVRLKTDPNDLIAAIMAWQGKPLRSPKGRSTLGYEHKKAPFESVGELRLIQYMTSEDDAVLEPFFTVFGQLNEIQMKVNLNTVHSWILKALIRSLSGGGDSSKDLLYNRLELVRRGDPEHPENFIAWIFTTTDLRPQTMIERLGLTNSPDLVILVSQLVPFLTVDSQFFFVHVETNKEAGASPREVQAILGRRGPVLVKMLRGAYVSQPRLNHVLNNYPYEILSWYEKVLT